MADKAELLAEAYRRGLLNPEQEAAFEEARRRGLIKREKRSGWDDATGFLATVNSRIPLADEVAAGAQTGLNLMTGRAGLGEIGDDYKRSLAKQRGYEGGFQAERPRMAALARGTGDAALMAVPTTPVAGAFAHGSRAINTARGAVLASGTAAVTAGADRGTAGERVKAATDAALNPVVIGAGMLGGRLAPAQRPAPKPSHQRTLREAGVRLTPGQSLAETPVVGGLIKNTEDLAQRAPILGPAISGARSRGNDSLNLAVANRAIEPLGETLPPKIRAGHEAVKYVKDRLGQEYDEAAGMVQQAAPDAEYRAARQAIEANLDELGDDIAAQYRAIMRNRVDAKLERGTPLTGKELRRIQSTVSELAARRSASDDAAQQELGNVLEAVSDELKALLGRFNPEAGARIQRANEGWSAYVRLRSAASKAPKDGVFTPGGLSTAVRMTDRSVGKGRVAEGEAVLQDLSTAASSIMPDQFGNPGTANAVGLGGLGVGLMTEPTTTLAVAGGLSAAATPYLLMGRQITARLPQNASVAQLREAAEQLSGLAAKDPKVADLYRQVAARLSVAAGAAAAPRGSVAVENLNRPDLGVGVSTR